MMTMPTPEQWQRILGGELMNIGGVFYHPQYVGGRPANIDDPGERGVLDHIQRYREGQVGGGDKYETLDTSGAVTGAGTFEGSKGFLGDLFSHVGDVVKDTAPVWLTALGANYLLPGLVGGEAAAAAGAGEAAAGGLLGGGGAGSLTSGVTPGSVAAFEAGLPSAAGVGSLTAGITPGAVAALEAGLPAAGAGTLAGAGGLGSLAGNLSGKAIGGLLGAAAGAANSGDKTQTTQQRLDPRMEAMLYGADGKGGYLGAATDWFNQNKGGNPLMLQGAQMMADFYRSPQYTEGYNSLRSAGLGLLNTPMAGNPFMRG